MSRRTSEASKAIRVAWEKEQQLVLKGMGTRNWTPEQQQSIIDKGKAYDDDGKALEGHHMKSAETYPMYQGDAENIQFLTRAEHQFAHGGSFHYFTNGYYDPKTQFTRKFGLNKYEPCKIIKLSELMNTSTEIPQCTTKGSETSHDKTKEIQEKNEDVKLKFSFKGLLKNLVIGIVEVGLPIIAENIGQKVGENIVGAVISNIESKSGESSGNSSSSDSSVFVEYSEPSAQRIYPDERSMPNEHDVSGYDRQQNGKTVHVNPYKRGGNKEQ